MKWKTKSGRLKEIRGVHNYLVDWTAKQGSEFSTEVLELLQPHWGRDIIFAELPVAGTKMRYDFVNVTKKIIVETDGQQHGSYNKWMHNGSPLDYQAQVGRDLDKDELAELNGFKMVRIKPDDLPKLRVSVKAWFKAYYNITL